MDLSPWLGLPGSKEEKASQGRRWSSIDWQSETWRPPSGPQRLQGSGRPPFLQHIWLPLAFILLGNIIKGLRPNHLFVLGVCFSGLFVFHKQDYLLVTGVVKSLIQSQYYLGTGIMFRYLCWISSVLSILKNLNNKSITMQLTTSLLPLGSTQKGRGVLAVEIRFLYLLWN